MLAQYVRLARPSHWLKNLTVIMPVVFGLHVADASAWGRAFVAVAAFCLVSSAAYVYNDIRDRQSDCAHPLKKNRPLASGAVPVQAAAIEAAMLLVLGLGLAILLSKLVFVAVGVYAALQVAYTVFFKQRVLVDVTCIALGFVLRAAAGALAIHVAISPWLFICLFTLCLFMGFCKRYTEVVTLQQRGDMQDHRQNLISYTPELLTHLVTVSAGIAVVAFLMYGMSDETVARVGCNYFVYTLPLVTYAVFRFAMLSMQGRYLDPTDLLLRDRPMQASGILWGILATVIIYRGGAIRRWIESLGP